jgi:hypothetical protein
MGKSRPSAKVARPVALLAGTAAVGVLAATVAAVPAAAAPASDAAARRCFRATDLSYHNGKVTAIHMFICDDGNDTDLPITLKRNGVTKATGKGIVTYTCKGTAVGTWTSYNEEEDFPCA